MTRVLIVDDNEEFRSRLNSLLSARKYAVEVTRNGKEALDRARQTLPDVVISDLVIPAMDGYTLLDHWRQDPALAGIPFIVYTGIFAGDADERLLNDLGADALIPKSASDTEIMRRIKQVLKPAENKRQKHNRPALDNTLNLRLFNEVLLQRLRDTSLQLEQVSQSLKNEIRKKQLADDVLDYKNAIMQTQLQNSLEAILVVSADGCVLSYNEQFTKLWGVPAELLEACRTVPLMESPPVIREIRSCLADPERYMEKIRYLHAHQDEKSIDEVPFSNGRLIELYSAPATGQTGEYYGRIWYYRDVTEWKRAQTALEVSEREQRKLLEMLQAEHTRLLDAQQIANVGCWETDLATMRVIWSEQLYVIFETDSDRFAPTHAAFLDLVHPDDRPVVAKAFDSSLTHDLPNRIEHRILLPTGKVRFVEENWRIFKDASGKPLRALGTCRDITEHRQLLQSLRNQMVQLTNTQRIARMGSWRTDIATGRVLWTVSACELFGLKPDELNGTYEQFRRLVVPEDLATLDAGYAQASPDQPTLDMEYRIRRPDGEVRWLYTRASVEFNAAGKAVSRSGTVMDITEEREAREQLSRNAALLRIAGKVAHLGGWSVETGSGRVDWSEDACQLHHMPPGSSPLLEEVFALYTTGSQVELRRAYQACAQQGTAFDLELQLVAGQSQPCWVRLIGEALTDAEGEIRQVQGAIQDISEQKAAAEEIHGLGNRLAETLESITDAFFTLDHDWNFTYVNRQAEVLLKRSRHDLLGRYIWDEFSEAAGTPFQHNYERAVTAHETVAFEEYYPPLGAWFEVDVYPSAEGLAVYFRDVTGRKDTEAQLAYLNRIRAMLGSISTLIKRANNREELFREACELAYKVGEFRMVMLCMVDPQTSLIEPVASKGKNKQLLVTVRNALASEETASKTMVARAIRTNSAIVSNNSRTDPQVLHNHKYLASGVQSMAILPLATHEKVIGALVLYAREIGFFQKDEMSLLSVLADDIAIAADQIEKQERLEYLSNFDTLTGLANRELFLHRLEKNIETAQSSKKKLGVALINIERFKNINDTLGRSAGDTLLRLVAEWIMRNAGSAELVGRIGADQFAVMFWITPEGSLIRLFEAIVRSLQEYQFVVNDTALLIAARAGIATFPDDGTDGDTLFRNAEAALKEARTNNERFVFYARHMNIAVATRLNLENQLRQAVSRNEFLLYYQPKVNLLKNRITGVEALIRWKNSAGELVMPGEFIPVLEETGMIADVGRWAIGQAIADYLRWRKAGLPAVRIAVNVSPLQLSNHYFIEDLATKIGIDVHAANGLELEITESVIMDNIKSTTKSLQAIRAMGIRIAIDDFGTGFSSLSYLSKLAVDTLKIDRSFVQEMSSGQNGLELVASIINLAHALKLKVVAEGVETLEQARLLNLLHCDELQGYLLSRPVPAEEFESTFLRGSLKVKFQEPES